METFVELIRNFGQFNADPFRIALFSGGLNFIGALLGFLAQKGFKPAGFTTIAILFGTAWFFELASVLALVATNVDYGWQALVIWLFANLIGGICGYFVSELLPKGD